MGRCNKSCSLRALSSGTYGSLYAKPRTAMKRSSSIVSRTPETSLTTHSFGYDPRTRPPSWWSRVTNTMEKHNNGEDGRPWRYRAFFVNEFASLTPSRDGSILDKFPMFPFLSWLKAINRFKYLHFEIISMNKSKKRNWLTLHQGFCSRARPLKTENHRHWNGVPKWAHSLPS